MFTSERVNAVKTFVDIVRLSGKGHPNVPGASWSHGGSWNSHNAGLVYQQLGEIQCGKFKI
jgi:hypothetical protein